MTTPQIDDGGPAHPFNWMDFQPTSGEQVVREQFPGLTKREHFAGLAMQGMCAHVDTWGMGKEGLVDTAYQIADMMIAAGKAQP